MLHSTRPASASGTLVPAPTQPGVFAGWRAWLAPILSVCCVVHCVGMALFAPLLPTAFAFLAANERCEWGLWIISAALVSAGLWRQRVRISGWFVVLWGVALVAGAVGLLLDLELGRQLSLVLLVLVQLCVLSQRVHAHRGTCDRHASGTTCCPAGVVAHTIQP